LRRRWGSPGPPASSPRASRPTWRCMRSMISGRCLTGSESVFATVAWAGGRASPTRPGDHGALLVVFVMETGSRMVRPHGRARIR
jgi:hypothetical protein